MELHRGLEIENGNFDWFMASGTILAINCISNNSKLQQVQEGRPRELSLGRPNL
jgi:hypothetical protein